MSARYKAIVVMMMILILVSACETPKSTATLVPPTDRPVHPTITPLRFTDTPVRPTVTPFRPTITPVRSTITPVPPTATSAPPTTATLAPASSPEKTVADLSITIIYDNTVCDPRLRAAWGFAAWLEYGDHTILFDTGGDGPTLLSNMAELGFDPQEIEAIVLSHAHADHVEGLADLLDTGVSPTVYVPASFPTAFKDGVRDRTDLVEVRDSLEIFPGVHSTGEIRGRVIEQALVVETSEGIVVITGCAHPGIVSMVRQAQEIVAGDIALVVGGFHLPEMPASQIERIIADFRELGVKRVSPTHCTGEEAISAFAEAYGADYVQGGVGCEILVEPDRASTFSLGDTWTRPADRMVMVYVPGGTFPMGSTGAQIDGVMSLCEQYPDEYGKCKLDSFEVESPQHTVTLDGFWIDRTEVTNAQYALCVADEACRESRLANDPAYNGDDYPVAGVPWQDAVDYCAWAGGRLPTEAEWEYAARGTQGSVYPWGDEFDCAGGNFWDDYTGCDDGFPGPAPVGSFSMGISWCGALDMAGNTWEWVADAFGEYLAEDQTNPTGPASGNEKILRGGSWGYSPAFVRTACRYPVPPTANYLAVGFRCMVPTDE